MHDMLTHKFCRSTKGTVMKPLNSLGFKPQQFIKGLVYFMWDILLPMPEDCVDVTSHDLITKDYIICTEYRGRLRTKVTVYEISDYILGENLGVYLMQYS